MFIKTRGGNPSSAFIKNNAWSSNLELFKNGIGYQINNTKSINRTLSLTNNILNSATLTLSPGWNWIGFINNTNKYLQDVIPNGKTGYFIKKRIGYPSSAFWNGTTWSNLKFVITPGEGYQFNLNKIYFSSDEIINITN